ncbi:alpha/beta hydrolase fold domain-containing protein [Nonomuraea sp. NPDC049152]|uniref:alpha/beta hydrolase fold domain-containing protein n=1 Tax=Nonomuraea sp. NPDC049152 TaxID=3154350 RepID=UPI0033E23C44
MRSLSSMVISTAMRAFGVRRFYANPDLFAWALRRRQAIWKEPKPPARLARDLPARRVEKHGHLCYEIGSGERQVFYLHGGGYLREIDSSQWGFVRKLATRLDSTVTVPLYPLVPVASAPEILDGLAVFYTETVLPKGGPVFVVGDSAGGNMALGLAQLLRERGVPQPERLILLSPHLDCTMSNPGALALERYDPVVANFGLIEAGRMYAGPLDLDDPLVSPINADLKGLAPITLFTGTREILYPDCRLLRDRAERAGVPLDYHEFPGMFHVWMMLPVREAEPVFRHLEQLAGR